jgi:beta-aspartyl-peptidase (threonine type)
MGITIVCRAVALWMLGVALGGAHARAPVAIAVHGGAGTIDRSSMSAEKREQIELALTRALRNAHSVLSSGGSSLDAVTTAVVLLEDSPHFNAGKGAVFNAEGRNELDAAIMEGHSRRAGAVAALTRVRNPIRAARAVMEASPHVFMIGAGAEQFAREQGLDMVSPGYFRTNERWRQFQEARREAESDRKADAPRPEAASDYYGTVGAVALDQHGHLAAATSTGGMIMKRYGRVGDVPVIGGGTWADDRCAVSATGWGEFFIRSAAAHEICARVRLAGASIGDAAAGVVLNDIPAMGGNGGVIAIDAAGTIAMPFSSAGMYRGTIDADGEITISIWADGE